MKTSFLLLFIFLTGCSLVPDYLQPELPSFENWRTSEEIPLTERIDPKWWEHFGNPELSEFVTQALAHNNDLGAALHRIEQAQANARIAGSALWPDISASADVSRNFTNPRHGENSARTSYGGGLNVAYEVDLFGRNHANTNAAKLAARATQFDYDALALVVASQTASAYINLVALETRLKLAENNLANQQEVLRITQERFNVGTLSALELAQQKTQFANTQAAIASLKQLRENQLNALAVLVGEAPQNFEVTTANLEDFTTPEPALLQPAELLIRRPDVKSTEAQLKAANFDIGAARAAFFPSLQLGAGTSLAGNPTVLASSFGASLAAPLFTGGALEGGLERANARQKELAEQYVKTVLVSFQEVQDALAANQATGARAENYTTATQEAETAYSLSRQRFDAGTIDFLTLLSTQSTLFQTQDAQANAHAERLQAAIDLYRTLGGGWEEQSP